MDNDRPITPPGPISITAAMPHTLASMEAENRRLKSIIDKMDEKYQRVIEALYEAHDIRVTDLIRANSEQVIRRREINAHRMLLVRYALKARDTFRLYERSYTAKAKKIESTINRCITLQKAQRNNDMAVEADQTVLWEAEPGEMGRP